MTKQENYARLFEEKAELYYNSQYDYSKVVYTKARDKVIIICPEHGEFTKTPNKHLGGQGCPECSNESLSQQKRKPFKSFLKEAIRIHKNVYTYDESTYKGAKVKMRVSCPEHGKFMMDPDKHLNRGQGCPTCGNLKMAKLNSKSTEDFIRQSILMHEDTYSYNNTEYVNSKENVTITCPVHGYFEQAPSNHLAGKGCRKCTVTGGGFDASKAGTVYYIAIDDGAYYKIGITNRDVWKRFGKDEHPRIRIVKEWHYPLGREAQIQETNILREHKNNLIPGDTKILRDGNTEIFSSDVLDLDY